MLILRKQLVGSDIILFRFFVFFEKREGYMYLFLFPQNLVLVKVIEN